MIEPFLKDEAFLQSVRATQEAMDGDLRLWWLGQSGYLLQWRGQHLLLDPYLSDSLTRKYAATDKPHDRITAQVVDPARLGFALGATSSHNHTDHLDAETLQPLLRANPDFQIVAGQANRQFAAERLGVAPERLVGLAAGGAAAVGPFTLHAVPAAHNRLDRDAAGHHRHLGFVVEIGPWRIYHSGDTLRYPGQTEWLLPWRIDLALLPINGNRPERRVAGNMDAAEAAAFAWEIGARMAIPCHYDLFQFNTADPADFAREAGRLGQPFAILRNGEGWSTSSLPARR